MPTITLVRHGQASFESQNYDQLSTLGWEQGLSLGKSLGENGVTFDLMLSGTMERQQKTLAAVVEGMQSPTTNTEINPAFNEYDFQVLLAAFREQYPQQWRQNDSPRRDYYWNIRQALRLWAEEKLVADDMESWQTFRQRIIQGLDQAVSTNARRILIVSSGGVIAVLLGHVLGLGSDSTTDLSLQIKNTAHSKLLYNGREFTLDSFNLVHHLEDDVITYS